MLGSAGIILCLGFLVNTKKVYKPLPTGWKTRILRSNMAKKKSKKRSKSVQKPAVKPVVEPSLEVVEMTPAARVEPLTAGIVLLSVALLLVAAWLIWTTLASQASIQTTTTTRSIIPLEGQANPQQLQSGDLPLQDQGSTSAQASDNGLNTLQPQNSLTPTELQQLQQ